MYRIYTYFIVNFTRFELVQYSDIFGVQHGYTERKEKRTKKKGEKGERWYFLNGRFTRVPDEELVFDKRAPPR